MPITQLDPADSVAMSQWRRGIGTRLLEEVFAAARRHRRSLIEIEAVRALPGSVARDEAGYRYLTNRAHQPGVTSVRSRCRLADRGGSDEATLAEAWAPADGYSLVQWRDAAYARVNEPALRVIDAWNAEENTSMRAVNTMLGFQPVDRWSVFQLPLPAA